MGKRTVLFMLLLPFFADAQDSSSAPSARKFQFKNSIQLDILGHGGFYSLNYERIIVNRPKFKFTAQVGVSYWPSFVLGTPGFLFPVLINGLYSINKHHIEVGFGHVFTYPKSTSTFGAWGALKLGYRYQKPTGKFLFKIAYTPLILYSTASIGHLGAITIGYAF